MIGQRIAKAYFRASSRQTKQYEWATMSGRDPFEYGMLTQEKLLAEVAARFLEKYRALLLGSKQIRTKRKGATHAP